MHGKQFAPTASPHWHNPCLFSGGARRRKELRNRPAASTLAGERFPQRPATGKGESNEEVIVSCRGGLRIGDVYRVGRRRPRLPLRRRILWAPRARVHGLPRPPRLSWPPWLPWTPRFLRPRSRPPRLRSPGPRLPRPSRKQLPPGRPQLSPRVPFLTIRAALAPLPLEYVQCDSPVVSVARRLRSSGGGVLHSWARPFRSPTEAPGLLIAIKPILLLGIPPRFHRMPLTRPFNLG